jgi:hypothetical protein
MPDDREAVTYRDAVPGPFLRRMTDEAAFWREHGPHPDFRPRLRASASA